MEISLCTPTHIRLQPPDMTLITEQNRLNEFCATLKNCPFITLDTEFLREKTYYPKLCLIQISDPDGNAAAIDPLAENLDLEPVFALLFDKNILKVIHSGRQDLEIFYNLTQKVVKPIFDTQIAAMVCGYGDSVGYEALVRNIAGLQIDKSSQFTDWSRRPLSDRQIEYALGDVTHLIKVYKHLAAELEKKSRTSWVFEEEGILTDPKTYENDPMLAWERIKIKTPKPKTLAVLQGLAAWRERQAQKRDVPKGWILRDETLADMAAQMPKNEAQLKKIRNMPEDLSKNHIGQTLIDIITAASQSDPQTWPALEKRKPLPPSVAATVDILRMLMKIQCTEQGVATKLLASTEDLEALAAEDAADVPAMKGWRFEMFGREVQDLKQGRLAIGLKAGKIVKFRVSDDTELYD
jgi:ribonuclease D